MRHVIQQIENEIKSVDNLLRHVAEKKKVAENRAIDVNAEVQTHSATLAVLTDQKAKLKAAVEGIKQL